MWDNNCHVVFDSSCFCVKVNTTCDVLLLQSSSSGSVYTMSVPAVVVSVVANVALTYSTDLMHASSIRLLWS